MRARTYIQNSETHFPTYTSQEYMSKIPNGPYGILSKISMLKKKLQGAFHLVCTHLGGGGEGLKSPLHCHCVLHAKRGQRGSDSM